MLPFKVFVSIFVLINKITCESERVKENFYSGEKFPKKYLDPENYNPTVDDVDSYLYFLGKVVGFFGSEANRTDINIATTIFFVKGIIRRTILEDGHKLKPYQRAAISHIMSLSTYILSHHMYANMLFTQNNGKTDEYRITQLFRDDDILASSLSDFNRNKLKTWILSRGQVNEFVEDMDGATLPKEKYAEIVQESGSLYHIRILISDKCLARISSNFPPKPENKELQACKPDLFCKSNIHASPSVAYSLSHRLLNMLMYRSLRHCYWVSPQDDELHMDILCSFMYREAVYVARRGFFARDLFLEHVSLCGMRGYTEFYRRHWFKKAIQWIDEDGCVHENHNFERNATVGRLLYAEDEKARKRILKRLKSNLNKQCKTHPMAVLTVFLANAARQAIHFF